MCPRSIAGVPSSQALPGYLITEPPSVCVPDVIGALAVWIQKTKQNKNEGRDILMVLLMTKKWSLPEGVLDERLSTF
jgi:hypothetical protein